jgi:hypothetical protein
MPETTFKRLLCCVFQRTGKAMRHVYLWWGWICREINIFSQVRVSEILRFILWPICPMQGSLSHRLGRF